METLSPAIELAWRAAASEAAEQNAERIEPIHLLIGVVSVEKFLQAPGDLDFDRRDRGAIEKESRDLNQTVRKTGLTPILLRRTLRSVPGEPATQTNNWGTSKLRRSAASLEAFTRAGALAVTDQAAHVELLHLAAALLELPDPAIDRAFEQLGKRKIDLQVLLLRSAKESHSLSISESEEPVLEVALSLNASNAQYPFEVGTDVEKARAALLYDLPLIFAGSLNVTDLLQESLQRIQSVIPAATHAALLTKDAVTGGLLLIAHVPAGVPLVSQTLARRVMDSRNACIWVRGQEDSTASLNIYDVHSGIYAPLVWRDEVLGVFLISSQDARNALSADDLRLVVALAHHAAMALANARLQNDLRRKSDVLERMLTNFSPRLRGALLEKASRGSLRLGGDKSEVTILCSDVRGFTKKSERLSTDEIVELLNDYFSVLVDAIFQNDGTIDKFLGDGILAVFGSPEPDPNQYSKALRAAVAMQDAVRKKNELRKQRGLTTCEIGIGLHCGEVFHGFVGTSDRMEFTVIGDAVNRTARYCDGAQEGQIIISPRLFQHTWKLANVGSTKIGTKHEGDFEAYLLHGLKNERA